jgi:hypothetical protein
MSTPLRDLLTNLLFDSPARAEFAADPDGFLDEHGWGELEADDIDAALGALTDELPIEHATRLAPALEDGTGDASDTAVGRLQSAIHVVDDGAEPSLDDPASSVDLLDADDDPTDGIDAADQLAGDLDGSDDDLDDLTSVGDDLDADALVDEAGLDEHDGFGSGDIAALDSPAGTVHEASGTIAEPDDEAPAMVLGPEDAEEAFTETRFADPSLDDDVDLEPGDDPDDPTTV